MLPTIFKQFLFNLYALLSALHKSKDDPIQNNASHIQTEYIHVISFEKRLMKQAISTMIPELVI